MLNEGNAGQARLVLDQRIDLWTSVWLAAWEWQAAMWGQRLLCCVQPHDLILEISGGPSRQARISLRRTCF